MPVERLGVMIGHVGLVIDLSRRALLLGNTLVGHVAIPTLHWVALVVLLLRVGSLTGSRWLLPVTLR